jgi:intracellular sulfur oxidation DsrE/DsrF family protein
MRSIHFFTLLLFSSLALAGSQEDVNRILSQNLAPFGVVFEIVEADSKALQWAIPEVNRYVQQLRARFPTIGLAVVSHGSEQFALMKSRQAENSIVHQEVQSLVASDIPVHVCGTHASWRGKSAADFPDYVDVPPAGPTEIRNYQAMGYELIVVKKP